MSRFRVALFIPDGVGIRNFVHGRFLHKALAEGDVDIFHSLPDDLVALYSSEVPQRVAWHRMLDHDQGRLISLLQSSLANAHMYWANTGSMQRAVRKPVRGSFKRRAYIRSSRALGRVASGPFRIRLIDSLHFAILRHQQEVHSYRELFSRMRPSVVFSTSQRHYGDSSLLPAVIAAKQMGIPTAAFIVSWDNLTSKGRIIAPFDHWLVWSDNMRRELMQYYPHISSDRIHIIGTPQFDPYADAHLLWDRREFFNRIGGDPQRPLICFSGGDAETCPEDPEHVRILLEQIRSGRIKRNPQVLVRPSPADDGSRYQEILRTFPEVIFSRPLWIHPERGDWSRIMPKREDVQLLTNVVHHSDMNVNLGSTMTLDFGLHDKPVVNVAFDVANPPRFGMPVYDYYYNYEHFRPVVKFGASRIARSAEQLPDHINAYLADSSLDKEGRRNLVNLHVDVPPGESCDRAVMALRDLSRN